MRLYELLETPITSWEVDPDLEKREKEMISKFHGYDREQKHWPDVDKEIIRNPETIKKIKNSFLKTPANFNLFFWQSTEPDYDKYLERGLIDMAWVKKEMSQNVVDYLEKTNTSNAINIIMTNNIADPNYIPIKNGWMLAHRIAHVLVGGHKPPQTAYEINYTFEKFIRIVVTKYYGFEWHDNPAIEMEYLDAFGKEIAYSIATMKSARSKKLNTYWEWMYETLVQYLLTGNIKFNPLPKMLSDEPLKKDGKIILKRFENKLKVLFDQLLEEAKGKVLVM